MVQHSVALVLADPHPDGALWASQIRSYVGAGITSGGGAGAPSRFRFRFRQPTIGKPGGLPSRQLRHPIGGWDLLDRGEADHQNVINAIRGAVAHEKARIQFEAAEEDSALFFFEQFFLTADQICKDAATDVKQNPEDSIAGQQDQAAPVTPFPAVRDDADH